MSVKIISKELLSHFWAKLYKVNLQLSSRKGGSFDKSWEVYDRGNGVTIILYNQDKNTLILTKQFRLPIYLNGQENEGFSVEACAGSMEPGENPVEAVKRETLEETGYRIDELKHVFTAYMSPGSVTEKVYFYIAPYSAQTKIALGGGLESEEEEVDILEINLKEAFEMVENGIIIDGKTIMLLQYVQSHGLLIM